MKLRHIFREYSKGDDVTGAIAVHGLSTSSLEERKIIKPGTKMVRRNDQDPEPVEVHVWKLARKP